MTTRKFQFLLVVFFTLIVVGFTMTVQVRAADKSPLPTPTATKTATATATPSPTATRTPRPTPTSTPILASGIVPTFPSSGYPNIDTWIFMETQQLRVHFRLESNGNYNVQAFPEWYSKKGDTLMTLCQFLEFERQLGYIRPNPAQIAANLYGCEKEQKNGHTIKMLNRFRPGRGWHEQGNLDDYFSEGPPTATPSH